MPVTFINKPKGNLAVADAETTSATVASPPADKAPEIDSKIPAWRNDLLPAFKVEMVPLTTLVSAHHPVRKQSTRQISRAVHSIQLFGFRDPLILGKGFEIIDGHVRVEAARRLGLKEIPCIDWRHAEVLMRTLRALGLDLINLCIWAKDKGGMGSLYRSQHEFVLVAKRPGAPHLNNVQLGIHGRNRTNLWRYVGATGGRKSEEDDFSLHPTVKPVRLVRDAILDVTAIGEVVLDPFLGSGTTIIAAELSKRIGVSLEISPAYVDVAIGRWEKLTGLEAVHQETGLNFAELRDARGTADIEGRMGPPAAAGPGTSGEEDF